MSINKKNCLCVDLKNATKVTISMFKEVDKAIDNYLRFLNDLPVVYVSFDDYINNYFELCDQSFIDGFRIFPKEHL